MSCSTRPLNFDDPEFKTCTADLLRRIVPVLTDDTGEDVQDARGNKELAVRSVSENCSACPCIDITTNYGPEHCADLFVGDLYAFVSARDCGTDEAIEHTFEVEGNINDEGWVAGVDIGDGTTFLFEHPPLPSGSRLEFRARITDGAGCGGWTNFVMECP